MEKVFEYNNCLYFIFLFFYIEHDSCEYGSVKYYIYCGIAGMLSCGLTHTAVVPLVCYLF
jgi:hypothetical protein